MIVILLIHDDGFDFNEDVDDDIRIHILELSDTIEILLINNNFMVIMVFVTHV